MLRQELCGNTILPPQLFCDPKLFMKLRPTNLKNNAQEKRHVSGQDYNGDFKITKESSPFIVCSYISGALCKSQPSIGLLCKMNIYAGEDLVVSHLLFISCEAAEKITG